MVGFTRSFFASSWVKAWVESWPTRCRQAASIVLATGSIALGTGSIASARTLNFSSLNPHQVAQATTDSPTTQPTPQPTTQPTIAPRRAATRITAARIQALLDRMVVVTDAKDLDGLLALYAQDAKVEAVVNTSNGPRTLKLQGRDQIRSLLSLAYPYIDSMKSSYRNLNVTIDRNGQRAIATYLFEQTARANGKDTAISVLATTTFQVIDQQILVTEDKSIEQSTPSQRRSP